MTILKSNVVASGSEATRGYASDFDGPAQPYCAKGFHDSLNNLTQL